ncbi:phage major capsid protein [Rhodococcus sp. PvP104]|uniref:phage major capsid protein n=1 Tax=Rhodococcus sp. PvP104 TaxID=2817911 RepID=UPI001AE786A1|nr:phage major capsid protein [Rhodococcus sp. PvP104]MBP2523711.1 HK97 family phage major capsid protein [Rhodococcus sp. PvP104]
MNINPLDKKFDHLRGLNNEQRAAKLTELKAYIEPFTTRDEGINAEESERLATALDELEFLGHLKEQRERLLNLHDSGSRENGTTFETKVRKDTDPTRDAALTNIERSHKAGRLTDAAATLSEALVGTDSTVARLAAVTGSEAYRTAFAKLVVNPERGHLLWTPEESQSYRDADQVRGLIEGAGGTGKHLVPFDLDPSIILTNAGSVSPLRAISRVVQTTSNAWNGVSSAGVTSEWLAEAAEAADATPTLAPEPIPVHKAASWVPFSIELEEDGLQLLSQLQALLADSALQLENTAFATGSGSGQPTGLITALVAAGGSVIVPAAGEALTAADIYTLQGALGSRWQPNASFAGNLAILNTIRQFETTNGALKFPGAQAVPANLLSRPLYEISGMDGTIDAAVTAANYALVYGDFSNFVIVDRIGTTVELVPHLMGSNRRPTGERGLYMHRRVGSDVVNANAFRLLNVATTA